jgi:hypothetical protein
MKIKTQEIKKKVLKNLKEKEQKNKKNEKEQPVNNLLLEDGSQGEEDDFDDNESLTSEQEVIYFINSSIKLEIKKLFLRF